ncbi:MAG: hypothetical protein RLZZ584_261 [Pseudomonadota bacterium]
MNSHDALIEEILKLPGVAHMSRAPSRPKISLAPDDETMNWDFYDSSYALRAGLEVTEREVPASLCKAVWPMRQRYPVRR